MLCVFAPVIAAHTARARQTTMAETSEPDLAEHARSKPLDLDAKREAEREAERMAEEWRLRVYENDVLQVSHALLFIDVLHSTLRWSLFDI